MEKKMEIKKIDMELDWSKVQKERVLREYHFEERDRVLLENTASSMLRVSAPVFSYIYDLDLKRAGLKPALEEGRYVLCCATLGDGIDKLQEELEKEEKWLEAYMLECISMDFLLELYEKGRRVIEEEWKEEPWYIISYDFLDGEGEWREEILKKLDFPVVYREGYLIPQKSVLYAARLSKGSGGRKCGICETCVRKESCSERKGSRPAKELLYGYMRILGGKG